MQSGILKGQVALVTGCGRLKGIGRATALALAAAGASVMVTDIAVGGTRNAHETGEDESQGGWKGLDSIVQEIEEMGGLACSVTGDVGLKADAERMVEETVRHFGKVDILVNNAGAPQAADRNWSWEVPEDAFDLVLRTNTKGVFLMSVAVVRHLLARKAPGRLINIASGAGKKGFPRTAAYSASKFAVIGLTQSMSQELGPHNITVNAVCPGPIATARQVRNARSESSPNAPTTPVQRMGVSSDIARTVVFLADPGSDYINGQSINVDGGFIMN